MSANKHTYRWVSPDALCWLSIPFIVLIGVLFGQHTLDIQLYDTYYVIAMRQYALAAAVLMGFLGAIYWAMSRIEKKINYMLSVLHLTTTIAILSIMALPLSDMTASFRLFLAILAVFTASQIVFLANIFLSFRRK